jgi:hypothetical protein
MENPKQNNKDNDIDLEELFKNAQEDPELFSKINIESLLDALEKDSTDYLENKTLDIINQEIFNEIQSLHCSIEKKKEICGKLIGYRLVNQIFELHRGKLVRTIKIMDEKTNKYITDNPVLRMHGVVMNTKFLDNGTHIVCMNPSRKFSQYKFDSHLTFQKLSLDEQLILMAYEHIDKNGK